MACSGPGAQAGGQPLVVIGPPAPLSPAHQLRAAAARGDLQEVVRLLGEGAKILPDEEGRTALHFSASAGHADIAAALLIAGASVNAADSAGCTALQRAAAEGHLDLVKQLIKHKADVNVRDKGPGNTALHEASWKGFSRCVQALCAVRGADLSLRNNAGFAPLHLACQNGHNQSCRELLLAGCDPDVRNNYGDTPLHTSARYGHAGVTRILVSAQCKVSEQNKNGDTSLHIAAAMGRRKLTRILLEAGCDKSLRNKQGETARDIATRKELSEILTILNTPVTPAVRKKEKDNGKDVRDGSTKGHKDKKKHKGKGQKGGRSAAWSPYGCHYYPDTKSFPQPKLDSLPTEPLRKGEQYYLDLAGNIRKGPVGVGYTCYCAPFFKHMEQRLDRDKHDLKRHINQAVEGLERRTQGHISQLTRSLAAERARCSQRHLHLQQWLRGTGPPRARSVDSLLEKSRELHGEGVSAEEQDAEDVGEEMEVLSEGDNTARRKESFVRRGGRARGKLLALQPRPGLSWDVLAAVDSAMAATDPEHRASEATADPLLRIARSRARRRQEIAAQANQAEAAVEDQERNGFGGDNLEVLDEVRKVSEWRDQQRRLMLEVARASREIAQLKRVACRGGSERSASDRESHGRDSRNSRSSRGGHSSRRSHSQALEQVDEGGDYRSENLIHEVEVHRSPSNPPPLSYNARSLEILHVAEAPSSASRWNGVSVTSEDIENWRRMDRLREAEQDILSLSNGVMINNPDYEIQVEDGMIFSSDLHSIGPQLPPLPQPQQPTAAARASLNGLHVEGALSNTPPTIHHPKPKFFPSLQKPSVPTPSQRNSKQPVSNGVVNGSRSGHDNPTPLKRSTPSAHVPLRKSVHEMVARIQNHMLHNIIGRQCKSKETRSKEELAAPVTHREIPIDVDGCVQVQARRVQACHHEDSESSDGEDEKSNAIAVKSQPHQQGPSSSTSGLGPDYENVSCWRDVDRHLVSDLPFRSRTAVYSPDVHPDFLEVGLSNGNRVSHHASLPKDLGQHRSIHVANGHAHSPTGTPDLELELHSHHPFLPQTPSPYLAGYPYSGGMYSPDHGDSGYSTRLGGSSNSKGTSPSLSGLDSDGLVQNQPPRSAAALSIATAAAAVASKRHTNASLV